MPAPLHPILVQAKLPFPSQSSRSVGRSLTSSPATKSHSSFHPPTQAASSLSYLLTFSTCDLCLPACTARQRVCTQYSTASAAPATTITTIRQEGPLAPAETWHTRRYTSPSQSPVSVHTTHTRTHTHAHTHTPRS
ncbi:hypothetical protein LY76DRAFT_279196 [Colletotrichum caudatum]|nr:hypothetical protein LY76DRAFT_279196 [Colletotrichum caudatum]